MVCPISLDGETGKRESEEGCPTVAKKHDGRLAPSKVIGKKSRPCSNDGDSDPAQSRLVRFKCHDPHESGYENRKPRGETIHAVEKIEGIRDPDNPEQRQQHIRNIPDWTTWKEGKNLPRGNDSPGCHKLGNQLRRRRQFPHVIDDTDDQ